MKKIAIGLGVLLLVAVAGLVAVLAPADKRPYSELPAYHQTIKQVGNLQKPQLQAGPLQVGWTKVNLTPPFSTPISTSESRGGKHYTMVEDSIFVRAFVFDNGGSKAALVTADLLIIPPTVTELLQERLQQLGLAGKVFFSATHTHSSIGGWAPGYVGSRFAGEYNPEVPQFIADKIIEALTHANADLQPASIGFGKTGTYKNVTNRLVGEEGTVDEFVRLIRINRQDGTHAAIVSFAAHSTIIPDTLLHIHRDYPGLLVDYLERQNTIHMAAFVAGAMGSMGPGLEELGPWLQCEQLAADLTHATLRLWNNLDMDTVVEVYMREFPIGLREPNFRVSEAWRIRPWVFRQAFGDGSASISCLRLGDILLVGTPCDFSGELVAPIDSLAAAHGKKLMLTSFNGHYCGYITCDKWYDKEAYETRTMNWFGPGTGAYFTEVIDTLVIQF